MRRKSIKLIKIRSYVTKRSLAEKGFLVSAAVLTLALGGRLIDQSLALCVMLLGIVCIVYVAWEELNGVRHPQ
jgi:hypothetical protein